jgi:hypothetical protein
MGKLRATAAAEAPFPLKSESVIMKDRFTIRALPAATFIQRIAENSSVPDLLSNFPFETAGLLPYSD